MDKEKLPIFFIDKNLGKMQLFDWGGELWLFTYNNPDWVSYRKATQEDIDRIEKLTSVYDVLVIDKSKPFTIKPVNSDLESQLQLIQECEKIRIHDFHTWVKNNLAILPWSKPLSDVIKAYLESQKKSEEK